MIQLENKHQEIIQKILTKYPYRFFAYGSRVKGKAEKYSDLDLCYQDQIPLNILSRISEDFEESDLPFKVDLVAWKWMSPEFQNLIEKDLIAIN